VKRRERYGRRDRVSSIAKGKIPNTKEWRWPKEGVKEIKGGRGVMRWYFTQEQIESSSSAR